MPTRRYHRANTALDDAAVDGANLPGGALLLVLATFTTAAGVLGIFLAIAL